MGAKFPALIRYGDRNTLELTRGVENAAVSGLGEREEKVLAFGLGEYRGALEVLRVRGEENRLRLAPEAQKALLLPEGAKINLRVDGSGVLRAGPFLGVFISRSKKEKLLAGGFDSVYWRFQRWAAQLKGQVIFFSLEDMDPAGRRVRGYYFHESKEWVWAFSPLPRVIYDRCFGRDGRQDAYALRALLDENLPQVQVYNRAVKIGKADTYAHLSRYPKLKEKIPAFEPFSGQAFYALLQKYSSLYVKPDKLYKGQGILRAARKGEGYELSWRDEGEGRNRSLFFSTANQILERLESQIDLAQGYILQGSIRLASYLGNPFDVRVMLQKRDPQTWEVTGLNARIAPPGSIITSPRSGGRVAPLSQVLTEAFPGREEEIIRAVTSFSREIGGRLEEKYGFLGELGVDLGLDAEGRVWLIEVNGKPLKVSFIQMKDRALAQRINRVPILLGFHLDGFPPPAGDAGEPFREGPVYAFKALGRALGPSLYLNEGQLDEFGLRDGGQLRLRVGWQETPVKVRRQREDASPHTLYLSYTALAQLRLPPGMPLALIGIAEGAMAFGPTVGMTVSWDTWKDLAANSYELKKTACLSLEKGALFYCFAPEGILWDRGLAESYYLEPEGKSWAKGFLPLPQVLYDQATYPFDPERRREAKEGNARMRENKDMQVINSKRYFGKSQTWKALAFFHETERLMPSTSSLTPLNMHAFLKEYRVLYAKSNYGSFGWGVMRVEREGQYVLVKTGGKDLQEWCFPNLLQAYGFLREKLGAEAVLQEAVALARMEGCPFDMRVLAQKDGEAMWVLSAVSLRIAAPQAVVTNVSSGARELIVGPGEPLPHPLLSWKALHLFCSKVLKALEAAFGCLGEVGLDVGVDQGGRLWLFEANSKLNTVDYKDLTTEEVCRQVYGLPLDYARHLTAEMLAAYNR